MAFSISKRSCLQAASPDHHAPTPPNRSVMIAVGGLSIAPIHRMPRGLCTLFKVSVSRFPVAFALLRSCRSPISFRAVRAAGRLVGLFATKSLSIGWLVCDSLHFVGNSARCLSQDFVFTIARQASSDRWRFLGGNRNFEGRGGRTELLGSLSDTDLGRGDLRARFRPRRSMDSSTLRPGHRHRRDVPVTTCGVFFSTFSSRYSSGRSPYRRRCSELSPRQRRRAGAHRRPPRHRSAPARRAEGEPFIDRSPRTLNLACANLLRRSPASP